MDALRELELVMAKEGKQQSMVVRWSDLERLGFKSTPSLVTSLGLRAPIL